MDALINVNGENFQTLQILLLTTLITLLPSIVVMMTSFIGSCSTGSRQSCSGAGG